MELFDSLDKAAADAGGALDAMPSLFDRLGWFRLVEAHCPPPGRPLVARARDGDGATAWLFLAERGGRGEAWRCWYSLRFGLVGAVEGAEPIARALRKRLHRLEIAPLEQPEPLARAFRSAGWVVLLAPATYSWRADTAGRDFGSYWAARPGRLRNTAQRKAKAAALDIE
ncbi:MAG TPA: hypothetical protein VEA60_13890, partial [Allosphingosinicella sp.]|nr:hypothetical protein [Allosphingosinicella sp.]